MRFSTLIMSLERNEIINLRHPIKKRGDYQFEMEGVIERNERDGKIRRLYTLVKMRRVEIAFHPLAKSSLF